MTFTIARRILILVVVPITCLVGLAGWILSERWAAAEQMRRVAVGGAVIRSLAELVTNLQGERGRSALFLGTKGASSGDLAAQRKETDGRLKAFLEIGKSAVIGDFNADVKKRIQDAIDALGKLDKLRSDVTSQALMGMQSNRAYAEIIEDVLEVSLVIVRDADHAQVKNLGLALSFFQAAGEKAGLERGIGAAGIAAGQFGAEQLFRLAMTRAEQEELLKLFAIFAPAKFEQDFASKMKNPDIAEADRIRQTILKSRPGEPVTGIEGNQWFKLASARIDGMKDVQDALLTHVVAEAENVRSTAITQVTVAASIVGTIILLVLGFGVFTMRSITRPMHAMTEAMTRLSSGDLSCDVPARNRKDEIGAMAVSVQVFKDNLIETERLRTEQAEAEKRAAEEKRAAMHKLANDFQAAVGGIIDAVSSASTELEAAANTLTYTAETSQQLAGMVASASEEASSNVQSVASASEEMASSINEISRQVQESSRIASDAVQQAGKTDSRINELSQAASRIGDVVKLITAIAEQTNLLALNATIEAARAGEAGRGFAVVAQEVKALASQTAKATDEISSQIAGMQAATQDSVTAIKEIGGTIDRISEIAATIAAAVEEQGAATQEIARNVQQASQGTSQVAESISEVNKGATETGSASAQVLSSAQSLSSESNRLKTEVDKFLNTVRAA